MRINEFTHTYKFEIQWNTGDEYWDNFPDYDEYEGTIEGLNDYLNSQLSEEDPPACFDKEAWRALMDGKTVYDETGARYSVKLMDNVNESLEKAKKLLKENGYIVDKAPRLDEWGKTLATLGLCLAMVLGIRACNGKWTESALKNINTKEGNALQLFNEYNQEEFGGVLSEETSMARAVFGAVIQYAQKNNCSIADAAKRIKKQFVGEWRSAISPDGTAARITSVLSTHDDEYGDIVMVSFRYQTGDSEHHTYKSSEVIIPASAASNYNKHVPVEHYKEAPAEVPANMQHYSQY